MAIETPSTISVQRLASRVVAAAGATLLLSLASCAADQTKRAAEGPPVVAKRAVPTSDEFTPDETLRLCRKPRISNRPAARDDGLLTDYAPFVEVGGETLVALSPTNGACFSSGFGQRFGRLHKGIDLQSIPPSMIVAAADGTVVQAIYRDDYGNMVLIDHGDGVYTRYAHLESFEDGVAEGEKVAFGQPLGMMGSTSKFTVALHLHYEILSGDLDNPKGSFGLEPLDPFALPLITAEGKTLNARSPQRLVNK